MCVCKLLISCCHHHQRHKDHFKAWLHFSLCSSTNFHANKPPICPHQADSRTTEQASENVRGTYEHVNIVPIERDFPHGSGYKSVTRLLINCNWVAIRESQMMIDTFEFSFSSLSLFLSHSFSLWGWNCDFNRVWECWRRRRGEVIEARRGSILIALTTTLNNPLAFSF